MKVVALGRTRVLCRTIEALAAAGHDVVLVLTAAAGDHYDVTPADFRSLADRVDAAFHRPDDINDAETIGLIRDHDPAVGVSVNWPTIVGPAVRDAVDHGIVNSHAGDLPRYRGNAAPNWAILDGEDEVVFTLHLMDDDFDTGPILLKHRCPLTDETYIGDVYAYSRANTPERFVEAVDGLESGTIEPTPQPTESEAAVRCYPRRPVDSRIDWTASAASLARLVRASAEPLPGAYTTLDGTRLTVWRARAEEPPTATRGVPGQVTACRSDAGEVAVLTGDGFLILERVQLDGRPRSDPTDVVTTTRTRLGFDVPTRLAELTESVDAIRTRLDRLEATDRPPGEGEIDRDEP
jgi:UDP-4-amino-4-deoxy-L-arabinose formyltransferase/UDP-glucuronic acid dehydrogenase (UDP-4-keto-hexauronic acid decarboxylating)